MSHCKNCQKNYPDTVDYCSVCGAKLEEGSCPQGSSGETSVGDIIEQLVEKAKNAFNKFNNTPDSTAKIDQKDIEENKIISILAYLSWLVLIPLFVARKSKFARFHCNQGIVLAVAGLLVSVVHVVVSVLTLGLLEGILGFVFGIIEVICVVLSVLGIVNVVTGKAKELPIVGKYRILK